MREPTTHVFSNGSVPASQNGRVMLIFPPVWLPMVPHLALPVLTAYLRGKGIGVVSLDANVEFFTRYLLTPETLTAMLDRLRGTLAAGALGLPSAALDQLQRNIGLWREDARMVGQYQAILRDSEVFFVPGEVLRSVEGLHRLTDMASLAQWPGRISFNHYRRGDIWTENDLESLCSDEERNVFLPFWKEMVLARIEQCKPSLVGISVSSVHQFIAAMTLARLLRKTMPHIHVVVGGKHMLRIQDKLLQHPFFFTHYFHSAVLHEGEVPLATLAESIGKGEEPGPIPGVVSMRNGTLSMAPVEPPPPLEELPNPDFSDVNWSLYLVPRPYAPLRMSRGCYWGRCTFCIRYGTERVDFLAPKKVVEEMARLEALYGVRDFTVNDDCMPPEYWEELACEILSNKLKVSMLIWAKPVSGFTLKRLRKMAEAGVKQIRWGVESAHPRVLGLMRKGTTLAAMTKVLSQASEAGIWNHGCFILGFPTETREEAQATLDFLASHRGIINSFILYPFVLYEHTHIFRHREEFGIVDLKKTQTPFFDILDYKTDRGMSPQEAARLAREAKNRLLEGPHGKPFWYYLKLREYLQLYLDRWGCRATADMSFRRQGLEGSWDGLGP